MPPEQVGDVLALMGDSIDNVPGRRGRRAQDRGRADQPLWLLEGLLAHVGRGEGQDGAGHRRRPRGGARVAPAGALREDVPLPRSLADLQRVAPDSPRLRALFRELEFTRLVSISSAPRRGVALRRRAACRRPRRRRRSAPRRSPRRRAAAADDDRRRPRGAWTALVAALEAAGAVGAGGAGRRAVPGRAPASSASASRCPAGAATTCRSGTASWARRRVCARPRRWPLLAPLLAVPRDRQARPRRQVPRGAAARSVALHAGGHRPPTRCWPPTCSTPPARSYDARRRRAGRGAGRRAARHLAGLGAATPARRAS